LAGPEFFDEVVRVARKAGTLVANDAAYSEITFDGYTSPSMLEAEGALEQAVEFHSFSKTFNMAGWRLGFAAGNAGMLDALRTLKSNVDSGVFGSILMAGAEVLEKGWESHRRTMHEYVRRRSMIFDGLEACGIRWHRSPATLYIWAEVPPGYGSVGFAKEVLERTGILVAPGIGFGEAGEGYFRISVTCPTELVTVAAERLQEVGGLWSE
jgi:LL-diaminopimelate aminotransferase